MFFDLRVERTLLSPGERAGKGIVAHVYMCRATRVAADFLRILGFWRCSSSIALHPP